MSAAAVRIAPSPMGLGDIFTTTFSVFRRRIGAFLGLTALQQLITVVVVVVAMIVAMVAFFGQILSIGQLDTLDTLDSLTAVRAIVTAMGIMVLVIVVASLVTGAISLYFTGVMITCANEATQQRFPTVSELRTLSKGFFGRFVLLYVAAMLLYGLAVGVAMLPMGVGMARVFSLTTSGMSGTDFENQMLATVLGSVLLSWLLLALVAAAAFVVEVKLAYVMQVCALEGLSGMAAVRRAWDITREAFWRTLGYLLVFGLAAGAAQQVVSAAGQVIMSLVSATAPMTSSTSSSSSATTILEMLQSGTLVLAVAGVYAVMIAVQLVVVPLKLIYVTVMYGDQVRRRELGPVAHAFGMNVPGQQYQGQPMYARGPQQYGPPQGGYGMTGSGQPSSGQAPQYGQAPQGYGQPGNYPTGPGYGQPPATTPYGMPTSYGQPISYAQSPDGHGQPPSSPV